MVKKEGSLLVFEDAKRPLLGIEALTSHLKSLNHPEGSINSFVKCGSVVQTTFIRSCSCSTDIVHSYHKCNLRICPACSKRRKGRFYRKYLPYLSSLPQDRTNFLYFLTISPKNYTDLESGLKHIKASWSKFIRSKYVRERIKGGLYVIEIKGSEGNWNIHLHSICYGRWLDNKVRLHKNSKIVRLFMASSNRPVNIHITRQGSSRFTLNYMLKYISANKDDFFSVRDVALYTHFTYRRRLIHGFGSMYNLKLPKVPHYCVKCGSIQHFFIEYEVVSLLRKDFVFVPPDLYSYV